MPTMVMENVRELLSTSDSKDGGLPSYFVILSFWGNLYLLLKVFDACNKIIPPVSQTSVFTHLLCFTSNLYFCLLSF